MPLKFGDVELQGPFSRLDELEDKPGLFAILCYQNMKFEVLDVKPAKLVQTEVGETIAHVDWSEICKGKVRVAVHYTEDENEVERIKQAVLWSEAG